MNQSPFVRTLLWVLGGVTLLLLLRIFTGMPGRSGLLVIEDVEAETLVHRSLDVERRIVVSIQGVGSEEKEDLSLPVLAAYGWILDRNTRQVVWSMDSVDEVQRGRGSIVEVNDTLALEGGEYEVFFASYGNRLDNFSGRSLLSRLSGASDWHNEARHWHLTIDLLEGKETDVHADYRDDDATKAKVASGERLIWSSGPVRSHGSEQYLFEVKQDTRIRVRSIGEVSSDVNDFGRLENVLTGEPVWELNLQNSEPAGGVVQNRMASAELDLTPGIYLASYRSDATHAYDNWQGNPPFDPFGWGLTVSMSESENTVTEFDPWSARNPEISMVSIGDDAFRATTFSVSSPKKVMMYGLGEMKRNDRYDYAWIERAGAVSGTEEVDWGDRGPNPEATVWEMRYEDSDPAGGDDSNRRTIAFLDLPPDTYTLFYRTDESHAFDDWRNGEPAFGDRWGVALFALEDVGETEFDILWQIDREGVDRDDRDRGGRGRNTRAATRSSRAGCGARAVAGGRKHDPRCHESSG